MSESPYIFDISGTASFEQLVIENSFHKPVLVDFWAEWCAPCKALMPMLAKLTEEYRGELLLAKVNCDIEQDIVMRFGIRSLPTECCSRMASRWMALPGRKRSQPSARCSSPTSPSQHL